jgi:ribonuclease BN (tRNA processing enzyme)
MNRFTILGSSNAVPKIDQENSFFLVETATRKILVDCGDNPIAKLTLAGLKLDQVTDIILTHFHADHVGSLPVLIMGMWLEKRTTPLVIHGLGFTLERANALLNLFDWQKWTGMYPVEFRAISEMGKEGFIDDREIKVSALPVQHLIPTIGLKFQFSDGKVISYSCDTEPCENLYTLANNAEVLIQESAGQFKGHTSAEQAGLIAAKANVNRLILVHYDSRVGEKNLLDDAKKHFSGKIELARDGMEIR